MKATKAAKPTTLKSFLLRLANVRWQCVRWKPIAKYAGLYLAFGFLVGLHLMEDDRRCGSQWPVDASVAWRWPVMSAVWPLTLAAFLQDDQAHCKGLPYGRTARRAAK